jgi:hypothetical protein
MKVYILKEEDFEALNMAISRDPRWGVSGGSGVMLSEEERKAHDEAHRFFNYQVRTWIQKVTA